MTAINEHTSSIVATTSYFEHRLGEIDSKIRILLQRVAILGDDNDGKEYSRLQDEKESAKRCLKICAAASRNVSRRLYEQPRAKARSEDKDTIDLQPGREGKNSKQECIQLQSHQDTGKVYTNVFEDVLAAQGSCQIIAVASEDMLSAVRVTAGAGAKQLIGHLSSSTLEGLLQDRTRVHEAQQDARQVMGQYG